MFNKMISSLSTNPSFFGQFAFYANRLKKEESIRRAGLIFVILAMFVQIGASMFPAEKSLAASSNDIIYGGVSSKEDLVNKCNNNAGVRAIYAKFGVTCAEISSTAKLTKINSSGNYWSMGRTPLSAHGISSDDWGERTLHAAGVTFYHRPLKAWGANVSYEAFAIKSGSKTYWILKSCGNLTTIGPESPTPDLEVHKTLLTPKTVKPGDTVKFSVTYRNTRYESVAQNFKLVDQFDTKNLDLVGMSGQNAMEGGNPVRNQKGLGFTATLKESIVVSKVKSNVANGTVICNTATVQSDEVKIKTSGKPCVTVVIPPPSCPEGTIKQSDGSCIPPEQKCPYDSSIPASDERCNRCPVSGLENLSAKDAKCVEPASGFCAVSTAFLAGSNKDIKVTTTASVDGNTKVEKYNYDLEADGKVDATTTTNALSDNVEFKNLSKGTHKIKVTINFVNGTQSTSKSCEAEVDIAEDARLVQSKVVQDDKGNDMDGKKISSGQALVFKLTTKNVTGTDSPAFSGEDYFGDVLEYADITNMDELQKAGVTLSKDKYLRWSVSSIKANSEDVKTVVVKVKNIVPSTNKPSGVGTDQDCVISNKFGNQVSVNVNCPLVKKIEVATTKLPNTGPGTTVAIAFLITVIAGYFFARARLLSKEARIVKNMYHQAI